MAQPRAVHGGGRQDAGGRRPALGRARHGVEILDGLTAALLKGTAALALAVNLAQALLVLGVGLAKATALLGRVADAALGPGAGGVELCGEGQAGEGQLAPVAGAQRRGAAQRQHRTSLVWFSGSWPPQTMTSPSWTLVQCCDGPPGFLASDEAKV